MTSRLGIIRYHDQPKFPQKIQAEICSSYATPLISVRFFLVVDSLNTLEKRRAWVGIKHFLIPAELPSLL
jgi:hypothetical protein